MRSIDVPEQLILIFDKYVPKDEFLIILEHHDKRLAEATKKLMDYGLSVMPNGIELRISQADYQRLLKLGDHPMAVALRKEPDMAVVGDLGTLYPACRFDAKTSRMNPKTGRKSPNTSVELAAQQVYLDGYKLEQPTFLVLDDWNCIWTHEIGKFDIYPNSNEQRANARSNGFSGKPCGVLRKGRGIPFDPFVKKYLLPNGHV